MQAPLPLDYIIQLIKGGYTADAYRGLESILTDDPANAVAWSLAAWVAPDSDQCQAALRKVIELTQDIRLRQWATRGLTLIEHIGTLDEEAPPALGGRPAQQVVAQSVREVRPPQPTGPKPRHPGYDVIQAGGAIMIGGVLLMVVAIASPAISNLFLNLPFSAGTCGFGLVAIGTSVAIVGYRRK